MKTIAAMIAAAILVSAGIAGAQLVGPLPGVGDVVRPLRDAVDALPARPADLLERARLDRIADLVRTHPNAIAIDPQGFPARAGEIVIGSPSDAVLAAAAANRFTLIERSETLGIGYARFSTPDGLSLTAAIRLLRKLGATDVTADQLHLQSGTGSGGISPAIPPTTTRSGPAIGMIDGGTTARVAVQRGFAQGAPAPSDHGSAVASLIVGAGQIRGAAPDARLFAADVYGTDPAGGSALAIVKALGWLATERVPVVTISLVGPPNPVLARVVAAAQAQGMVVVAAVGNDGPASPLAFPASYPGVIAVTAIDRRKRVLIEAGRASHLDYAAPGADMAAANKRGDMVAVRGTSFAAPFVAAMIARHYRTPDKARRGAALAQVDAGAERAGKRYGHGIVCGTCATPPQQKNRLAPD